MNLMKSDDDWKSQAINERWDQRKEVRCLKREHVDEVVQESEETSLESSFGVDGSCKEAARADDVVQVVLERSASCVDGEMVIDDMSFERRRLDSGPQEKCVQHQQQIDKVRLLLFGSAEHDRLRCSLWLEACMEAEALVYSVVSGDSGSRWMIGSDDSGVG